MWSHLPLKIRRGEVVETNSGPIKASADDVAWLRHIRAFLLEVFARQGHVGAAELKNHVGFPHELDDVARLLGLLAEDCFRRGEPSLAELVTRVPDASAKSAAESTELISQNEINDLLNGFYGGSERHDEPDPAPEPA